MSYEPQEFLESVAAPLGWFYLTVAGANAAAAWRGWRQGKGRMALAWLIFAGLFGVLGGLSFLGIPPGLAGAVKATIDGLLGPVTFTLASLVVLIGLYLGRRLFVRPAVAWTILNASLLFLGLSLADVQFAAIAMRPDNVPIVAMVYLLGFFVWLGAAQAVENDDRLRRGRPPVEKEHARSILVWPDLVYIELITMVILAAALIVWSQSLRAPLEQPANPAVTPNPSKAPWYFVGLQEMLVYFDPAMAGVILPSLIILGLAAIPYLDFNPKGSGYYTIAERKFSYPVFLFGFLQLWILLILIGTFFRGPNWSFFGLYEPRDPQKILAIQNVKLSESFWVSGLGRSVPQVPAGGGVLVQLGAILWREIAGITVLGLYFVALPVLLGRTVLGDFRRRMGGMRYWIMALLLLMMVALPLKMILRWTWNLSYVVSIPEYFFNF
jgi:Cytochrome b(C-terminal)/b6/petD